MPRMALSPFDAATAAYYAFREASDLTKPRYLKAAKARIVEYADTEGIGALEAMTRVADWVDEHLPVDGLPADH